MLFLSKFILTTFFRPKNASEFIDLMLFPIKVNLSSSDNPWKAPLASSMVQDILL